MEVCHGRDHESMRCAGTDRLVGLRWRRDTATAYARDKLQRDYGRDISELLGFPNTWRVK